MSQKEASIFFTLYMQIPELISMCRQFVASIFGHPLVVNISDYLLFLVVTSLECTETTNNSNI